MFAYGQLAVVLPLYLAAAGLRGGQIGLLLGLALIGDTLVTLAITSSADRIGRRKALLIGGGLLACTGVCLGAGTGLPVLLVVATLGVVSPSGYEVGPFLSVEQAALTQIVASHRRTWAFAWYNLVGSFSTALGSLVGGVVVQGLQSRGVAELASCRVMLGGYSIIGGLLIALALAMSSVVEPPTASVAEAQSLRRNWIGLGASRGVVAKLAGLFAIDAFGGGFVLQSMIVYWFRVKYDADPATLGAIFFGANTLAGISSLSAAWVASKIGLINTMVFTHLPSNVLLMLVPVMPTMETAILVLLLRFSISQMDVPTRQSYTMAIVAPSERSAAGGVTGVARTVGASLSPFIAGPMLAQAAMRSMPFFASGALKIAYDLLLWRSFKAHKPPEESPS